MVTWVHGGGYVTGDKTNQMTDKITLFNGQGWILVSVNYRLSAPDKGAGVQTNSLFSTIPPTRTTAAPSMALNELVKISDPIRPTPRFQKCSI